jgi:flagellar hook-basal body complex protein FliE
METRMITDSIISQSSRQDAIAESLNRAPNEVSSPGSKFADLLRESIANVNQAQQTADAMAQDIATGKSDNIHETMIAISKAELGFNFMVQVRNKVLEAYQDIMKMPV